MSILKNLMPYIKYGKYVVIHKYFVYKAARYLGLGFWQSFIHDWSKFLPLEFRAYTNKFYKRSNDPTPKEGYMHQPGLDEDFDRAWLSHIHRNPHHWQHWLLTQDEDEDKTLRMPAKYAIEMAADHWGAGMAQGKPDIMAWYVKNAEKIVLHPESREIYEQSLTRLTAWETYQHYLALGDFKW